ncbi:MAG TPA: cyanophycin synthetase, partial [Thermoanaerobaculia bacterium]|nr:cyanophycin synthetase [Thermoanaerobaculia bacterium]
AIHNVQNAMFAAAIAHGLGIGLENIRQGLRTFSTDFYQTPGRMNFYYELPFRVLLDYAHNAHGMLAMARTVRGLTVNGRRIGVLSAPGDRRDEDIREIAAAAAPAFDYLLLREDDNRRGRKTGEIGAMLRQGLLDAGFPADRISDDVYDEEEAVQRGLETARPGDLLVVFGDDLNRSWNQIVSFGRPPGTAPMAQTVTPQAPLLAPDAPARPETVPAQDLPRRSSRRERGERGEGDFED